MVEKLQKLKFNSKLLLSTFFLAFYMIFAFNLLIVIIYLSENVNHIDLDIISISTKKGYYVLNDEKIGIPILYSFLGLAIVWILIVLHTLKILNKPINYIFNPS